MTRRAFTLAELIVVMAIIAILATTTLVALGAIAKDARRSTAVNTIAAILGEARTVALRSGRPTLVAFRSHLDEGEQHVEAVLCQWTGETYLNGNRIADRFVPVPDQRPRVLPAGIKVASPRFYGTTAGSPDDLFWETQIQLSEAGQTPVAGERFGSMIAVVFDGAGTVATRNSITDSNVMFVDFDRDGFQMEYGTPRNYTPGNFPNAFFYDQRFEDDEPYLTIAPYLAVYDDDAARELRTLNWANDAAYENELLDSDGFISRNADRLHFNRYTGVVMR